MKIKVPSEPKMTAHKKCPLTGRQQPGLLQRDAQRCDPAAAEGEGRQEEVEAHHVSERFINYQLTVH